MAQMAGHSCEKGGNPGCEFPARFSNSAHPWQLTGAHRPEPLGKHTHAGLCLLCPNKWICPLDILI